MSWSVKRIKHPRYPEFTVRVREFESGGSLHVLRQVNGKQMSRSLKYKRRDLGSTQKTKERQKCWPDALGLRRSQHHDHDVSLRPDPDAAGASGTPAPRAGTEAYRRRAGWSRPAVGG